MEQAAEQLEQLAISEPAEEAAAPGSAADEAPSEMYAAPLPPRPGLRHAGLVLKGDPAACVQWGRGAAGGGGAITLYADAAGRRQRGPGHPAGPR